ncbi:MAG: hypothetical protein JSV91_06940 [Phycisphaerales bacterium]|nr:MAG: hypothetical protein JSV91_06940 [Phycisphaerales bacterium]
MSELREGDLLFKWVKSPGSKVQGIKNRWCYIDKYLKNILVQKGISEGQARATRRLLQRAKSQGTETAGQHRPKLMKWSDNHVLHVGICDAWGKGNQVMEVQSKGLIRSSVKSANQRGDKLDIVVRFDEGDREKICRALRMIPQIKYDYPQEVIGINPLAWNPKKTSLLAHSTGAWYARGEMTKTPARETTKNLPLIGKRDCDSRLMEWFRELRLYGRHEVDLNRELNQELGLAIRPFVCSHAVFAILHEAAFTNSFASTLLDWTQCALSPAQLFRQFMERKGVFRFLNSAELWGVAYLGEFQDEDTAELIYMLHDITEPA